MAMAGHSHAQSPSSPSSLCSCSSLSTAFMRFKQDNDNIRADIEELKYKSRTLPRVTPAASVTEVHESTEPASSHASLPSIERKLDRLTTLIESVALDVKTQSGAQNHDVHSASRRNSWRCPGCGVHYHIEEDNTTLLPTPVNGTLSSHIEDESLQRPEDVLARAVEHGVTIAVARGLGTPEESEAEHEEGGNDTLTPSTAAVEGESGEREETESASAEAAAEDLQTQILQSNLRVHELEMKTAELLRMNYTWQEYFQIMTARMDDERFLWRLQLGELDRNVDSGPLLAQLHERLGLMERERLESMEKINALTVSLRESEERMRTILEEMEQLRALAVPPEPEPCDECARLSSQLADSREQCAWLTEKHTAAEERCVQLSQEQEEMLGRSDAMLAECEGLREQLSSATAEAEKWTRRVAQLQAECESLRLANAAVEARREGDTSPTQLSQLGHMQTISAWNCPSCNCKNPPFTPMCHKCHRGQRPPPFNPYVLDRS